MREWGPPENPCLLVPYYNMLAEALKERVEYFNTVGIVDYYIYELPTLTHPVTRDTIRNAFTLLKENITNLLCCCIDARQIGEWVDFTTDFSDASDVIGENINTLLAEMALPPEAWWFEPKPFALSKTGSFFKFCYRLLNEMILYPEIEFIQGVSEPGSWFGVDSTWELEDHTEKISATGRYSEARPPGYHNFTGSGYEGAYYYSIDGGEYIGYKNYKIYGRDMRVLNQMPLQFKGQWQMRYRIDLVSVKTYFSDIPDEEKEDNFYETGDYKILEMTDNSSGVIAVPSRVQSWVADIRSLPYNAKESGLPYWCKRGYADIVFDNGAFLKWENMPELPYKYYSKGE